MSVLTPLLLAFLLYYLCTPSAKAHARDVYSHAFTTIDGQPLPLEQYRGKVLLIVNTASRCGFTKQYKGLQKLYDSYREQGLVVLAVPSNDFGQQEPGSPEEIKKFCEEHFHVTFPIAGKTAVAGKEAHPFFRQVRRERGYVASAHWNFYKYLIGRDGCLITWFFSITPPDAGRLVRPLRNALAKDEHGRG